MYKNPRLKHVKKIRDICTELEMRCAIGGYTSQILTQCNLLLETKKKRLACGCKKTTCACDPSSWTDNKPHRCYMCPKKDKKYSLPNEKEILGMLDGLTIIVRK